MNTTLSTATADDTDALILLDQVIAIDGYDNVVVSETSAINGSGRVVGTVYEITPDVAEFITEALARQDDDQ